MASGPLNGVKVVEFAGLGPAPFCAMLLSDLGAEVLRIDRLGAPGASTRDPTSRGRRSLAVDLKDPASVGLCLKVLEKADVLIEGFRPGVMERLGLGPDVALARNPRLVYGRLTGWGQTGPLAHAAGHDLNYIALTGALNAIGPREGPPVPPLNLVGDYGGGSLYLAFGITAALFEAQRSGQGQVIDAAIVDGAASLMTIFSWLRTDGLGRAERGQNFLDGTAPFYRCYECADGKFVAVGPIEPHFWAELLARIGVDPADLPPQMDPSRWAEGSAALEAVFKTKSQAEWCDLLEGTDACFAPVVGYDAAHLHPHMAARATFTEAFGIMQPGPAPRFSRTPGEIQGPPPSPGEGGDEVLRAWGITP